VRELVRELWDYRELLRTLVIRELRVRYKNSALGFFWSLLNPLATVLVMTIVFKYVMGMRIANYSAYILAAYLPWTFFQFALLDSSQTILVYMQVIRKIYFPRVLLPLAAVLSNFIHFCWRWACCLCTCTGMSARRCRWGCCGCLWRC
jgi:ABC-type polysaccharide/polyol phosphate export permease